MIKKILLALAILIPTLASAQKFAIVDPEVVMQNLPAMKEVEEKVQASASTFQSEFDKLREEIDKKYAEYQALAADTPATIKERRQQEIQELAEKAQRFQQQASQDLERQHAQLLEPIQKQVLDAIKSVGAEGGYTMVFPAGVSLYTGTDVTDITEAVKLKLGIK